MRRARLALLLTTGAVSLLLFPLGSFGRSADENTWSGTWNTTFGVMTLTQEFTKVSGTYAYEGGKITAQISGNVASGTWSEAPTFAGPSDAGPFTWTMSSGKSWSGTWSYASGSPGGSWSGTCTGGACLKNGQTKTEKFRFSVNARNRIGSRIVGSGTITIIERGASTSTRVTGTIAHTDEYFTQEQDERLGLRIVRGQVQGGNALGVVLTVVVTTTSHPKACRVGAVGKIVLYTEDKGVTGHPDPADAQLLVCGREHAHKYVDSTRYPVTVKVSPVAPA